MKTGTVSDRGPIVRGQGVRMDVWVIYNTSSTDDEWGNARKHENSPFLSKNRDEKAGKIFNKVAKKCTWVNFVIIDFQILIGSI